MSKETDVEALLAKTSDLIERLSGIEKAIAAQAGLGQGPSVVVVEDDSDMMTLIAYHLKKEYDIEPVMARSLRKTDLTERSLWRHVDLVIMDVMLETDITGVELSEWLSFEGYKIPVVLNTSLSYDQIADMGRLGDNVIHTVNKSEGLEHLMKVIKPVVTKPSFTAGSKRKRDKK